MTLARAGTSAFQTLLDGLVPFNQGWANKASALIAALSKQTSVAPGRTGAKPNPWHSFDAGSAWMSLAFQAGWVTHGMGGFDGAKLRESLQARELPNDRLPLAQIAAEGGWAF